MRNGLGVRATVSIGRIAARSCAIAVEWTTENRQRIPRGAAVERKELLIEGHQLRRRLISRSGYGVHTTARQLLQNIALKWACWHCRGTDDRQRNPKPFGIKEGDKLVMQDRASET